MHEDVLDGIKVLEYVVGGGGGTSLSSLDKKSVRIRIASKDVDGNEEAKQPKARHKSRKITRISIVSNISLELYTRQHGMRKVPQRCRRPLWIWQRPRHRGPDVRALEGDHVHPDGRDYPLAKLASLLLPHPLQNRPHGIMLASTPFRLKIRPRRHQQD